jgi:cholesterol transport system auxiliary component
VRVAVRRSALMAYFLLLSACTLFGAVDTDSKKHLLKNVPVGVPTQTTHQASLLVLTDAMPVYATTRMAYSTQAYQIAYFAKNEWAETPSQMVQPLLVQTLQNTRYFTEVLSSPDFGRHTFALRVEILELMQDFTSEPAMLQLAVRVSLTRDATDQVIATKEFAVSQPMSKRDANAGVAAANEAMPKLLEEVTKFVIEEAN